VSQLIIAGHGGNDSITSTPLFGYADYVVSSNQDSANAGTLGDSLVDLDPVVPGNQVALRAAIVDANGGTAPRLIYIPRGKYNLALTGTESGSTNDLDVSGSITILGTGVGETIINASGLNADGIGLQDRVFDASGAAANLRMFRLTLTGGNTSGAGGAILVQSSAQLELGEVAVVGNTATGAELGGGIRGGAGSSVIVRNSVFTGNSASSGGAIYADGASLTIGRTVFGLNTATSGASKNVFRHANTSFVNEGVNRVDDNQGSLFSTAVGDYISSSVHYIVTGVADTSEHADDSVVRSIRDAIDTANTTAGTQEIWLPAWKYFLTRERTTAPNLPELDVHQGDLEVKESLVIRGVNGATSVVWRAGILDKVFELLGDYNDDGVTDVSPSDVDTSDYIVWRDTEGSMTDLSADGDDNGIVDDADYQLWQGNFGWTLMLHGIA
jgi:predicted outer membrane repeat protein